MTRPAPATTASRPLLGATERRAARRTLSVYRPAVQGFL